MSVWHRLQHARTKVDAARKDLADHIAAVDRGQYRQPTDAVRVRCAWTRLLGAALAELRAAEIAAGLWPETPAPTPAAEPPMAECRR